MRFFLLALALAGSLFADVDPGWKRPFPPTKIAGNVYYVGTEDLACYLVTTPAGHILINTGLEDSMPLLKSGIEKLGFKLTDVKILLTMQAHFDHMAAMAEVRKLTGARLLVTDADAPFAADGAHSDPSFGKDGWFKPVPVDGRIKDGDVVKLGGTELRVVYTPGHSKGSVSYTLTVNEGGRSLQVAIVNMPSVVMRLVNNQFYPNIVPDLEFTFTQLKKLHPDIWVCGHASQFHLAAKAKAGSFVDPAGYAATVAEYEKAFRERLASERKKAAAH